ncbi:MAG: hypothetical protein M0R06_00310 [Sphaerochaeta sp.]|nr:hypothetical protein [Sphaerochaeta sp.]
MSKLKRGKKLLSSFPINLGSDSFNNLNLSKLKKENKNDKAKNLCEPTIQHSADESWTG